MITYRIARPEEREECIAFITSVFNGAGDPVQFETDIPKVYAKGRDYAFIHRVAADDQKGIRAVIACLPNTMHIGEDTLKTGYVGSVSVHPESRGEGHMTRLMDMTLQDAQSAGMDLLILGGRRQRYAYYGYETGGFQYQVTILDSCVRHALKDVPANDITFEKILPESLLERQAAKLHQKQWAWMDRPLFAECCASFLGTPYAAMRNGVFIGYVVKAARSMNLSEAEAELPEELDAILKAWQVQNQLKKFTLTVAGWDKPRLCRLWSYAEDITEEANGRVRILNWRHTVETLLRLKAKGQTLRNGRLSLCIEGAESFDLCVENNRVRTEACSGNPLKLSQSQGESLMLDPFAPMLLDIDCFGWFPLPLFVSVPDEF